MIAIHLSIISGECPVFGPVGGLDALMDVHPKLIETRMKKLTKELLKQMQGTFPTLEWSDAELDDLVKPSFGLITGFPELLTEIDRLCKRNLKDLPPAGILSAPEPS